MNIKNIVIIIVILLILSSIPFWFGKHIEKNVTVDEKSESVAVDNSKSVSLNELEKKDTVTTTPNTPSNSQPSNSTLAPKPSPTPTIPTPTPTPTPTPAPAQTPPSPISITINQFAFQTNTITVTKGTKITWTNKDSAPHTVTSDASSVFGSGTLGTGDVFSFTFNTVGTFNYHCAFHPSMRATVIVTN